MKYRKYDDIRSEIKTGDLLAWSTSPTDSAVSNLFLWIVKFFTNSRFGHVGIAWRTSNRLMVVEATIPFVRVIPVSKRETFYWIPVPTKWESKDNTKLLDYLGLPYSLLDCVRAYLGKTDESNDRWQCAELCKVFYEYKGLNMEKSDTPVDIVNTMVEINRGEIYFIAPSTKTKSPQR